MTYDPDNIFAKILRGEIPCDKVLETEHALAFRDIHPQAPVHILVIPRGPYRDHDDFCRHASAAEITGLYRAVSTVAEAAGLSPAQGGSGYRILANTGPDALQDVPHYHVHVAGGGRLGPMLPRPAR